MVSILASHNSKTFQIPYFDNFGNKPNPYLLYKSFLHELINGQSILAWFTRPVLYGSDSFSFFISQVLPVHVKQPSIETPTVPKQDLLFPVPMPLCLTSTLIRVFFNVLYLKNNFEKSSLMVCGKLRAYQLCSLLVLDQCDASQFMRPTGSSFTKGLQASSAQQAATCLLQ